MILSRMLPAIITFIVFEGVNTVANILPALKETTVQGRNKRLVRAGIVNFILLAGLIAFLVLDK